MINKIQREVSNDTNNNAFRMISLIAALDVAFAHTLAHVLGGVWSNI